MEKLYNEGTVSGNMTTGIIDSGLLPGSTYVFSDHVGCCPPTPDHTWDQQQVTNALETLRDYLPMFLQKLANSNNTAYLSSVLMGYETMLRSTDAKVKELEAKVADWEKKFEELLYRMETEQLALV